MVGGGLGLADRTAAGEGEAPARTSWRAISEPHDAPTQLSTSTETGIAAHSQPRD
jgi:hypothetical protein